MSDTPTAAPGENQIRLEVAGEMVHLAPVEARMLASELTLAADQLSETGIVDALTHSRGVGERTAEELTKRYGTLDDLLEADADELEEVHGIGRQKSMEVERVLEELREDRS